MIPSLLTAFLGYFMEVLALMVDLGRPERIWHMMIYQNFTSTMLLVGLCVMFYLAVLAFEFAPTLFDGLTRYKWAARLQPAKWSALAQRFMLPVVIIGVVISVVHQGVTTTKTYNEQSGGGQWVLHGTYSFDAGTGGYVQVSDTGGQACADAVRFEPAP